MTRGSPDPPETNTRETHTGRWLLVRVSGGIHALALRDVVEVVEGGEVTRLPGAPPEVSGLVNHRGTAVTVVDLRFILGARAAAAGQFRHVLIRWRGLPLALAVDDVVSFSEGLTIATGETVRPLDLEALFEPVF